MYWCLPYDVNNESDCLITTFPRCGHKNSAEIS